jgi:cysteine peptidase B
MTMQSLLLVTVPMAAAQEPFDMKGQWTEFKAWHGLSFLDPEEEAYRLSVFESNLVEAAEVGRRNPLASFGVTKFSAMTKEEFHAKNGYADSLAGMAVAPEAFVPYTAQQLQAVPPSLDWRNKGAVTPVKDQGQCGSCYAFSTTGNIEGQWAAAGNPLVSLSEQEFVSCVAVTPPGGQCHGGLPSLNFQWLMANRNGDVLTESAYPYGSHDFWSPPCTQVCHALSDPSFSDWCSSSCYCLTPLCPSDTCDCKSNGTNVGATITGWKTLPSDEEQMRAYLAEHGPVSIGVDSMSWQHYQGGIVTDCGQGMNDHAVLLVGFGEENGTSFWIIKNSWAESWGESGYMRTEFGTNQCNLNHEPTTAVVAKIVLV